MPATKKTAAKKRAPAAKTNAERQDALRVRRAQEGLTEVRGVYAKAAHHAKIKAFAKTLYAAVKKPAKGA